MHQFRKELKGCKLLDKDRFIWSAQGPAMSDEERRKHCRGFLTKGLENKPPIREEFTAYGQACLEMARGMFQLLREHEAKLFAAAIPRNVTRPDTYEAEEFLRKDQVFLLECLASRGMDAAVRNEIADEFGPWLNQLQFRGEGYRDGSVYQEYGIVYVPDPYTAR